jgi:hypothetical protein
MKYNGKSEIPASLDEIMELKTLNKVFRDQMIILLCDKLVFENEI